MHCTAAADVPACAEGCGHAVCRRRLRLVGRQGSEQHRQPEL